MARRGDTVLHQLAADPDAAQTIVRQIQRGAPIDALNARGETPLLVAINARNDDAARVLINAGADVDAADARGNTPLGLAVATGRGEIVRRLLRAGAAVNRRNARGETPLFIAAQTGDDDVVVQLLAAGANPALADENGRTPLHVASSAAVVRELARAGADVNARDRAGRTPLHSAMGEHDLSVAEALLRAGADARLVDGDAIAQSIARTKSPAAPELLASLIRAGMRPGSASLGTAILERRDPSMVRVLLESGINPNAPLPPRGELPLTAAVRILEPAIVHVLLAFGANPNAISPPAVETPLHTAIFRGALSIVQLLLRHGADPNLAAPDDPAPLVFAATRGAIAIARELVRGGADISRAVLSNARPPELESYLRAIAAVRAFRRRREARVGQPVGGTTDWQEICAFVGGNFRLAELRNIAKIAGIERPHARSKRELCAELATQMARLDEILAQRRVGRQAERRCVNDETLLGNSVYDLDDERFVAHTEGDANARPGITGDHTYCFEIDELTRQFAAGDARSPYTRTPFPEPFIAAVQARADDLRRRGVPLEFRDPLVEVHTPRLRPGRAPGISAATRTAVERLFAEVNRPDTKYVDVGDYFRLGAVGAYRQLVARLQDSPLIPAAAFRPLAAISDLDTYRRELANILHAIVSAPDENQQTRKYVLRAALLGE